MKAHQAKKKTALSRKTFLERRVTTKMREGNVLLFISKYHTWYVDENRIHQKRGKSSTNRKNKAHGHKGVVVCGSRRASKQAS